MTTADERAARLEEAVRLKRAAARARAPELPPRPPQEPALLGEMQRSLWLLHQLEPRSAAYNLASAYRVHGPLELATLEQALERLVARHRLLRSTFRVDRGGVLQVVGPPTPQAVERLAVERGEGPAAAVRAAREPFDLERGPLVRMLLVEEAGGSERVLLLVLHHILCDERSLGVLWRELAAAYGGRPAAAPPASQYDDWVHWAARRDPAERRRELDFWRRRLDPPPGELQLPFETATGEGGEPRGRLISRALDAAIQLGVHRAAAATGASPFTLFAFAFRLLLERYTAGRPVAFATPVSTRSHPATAEMVGYFLNPVVVPARIDERRPVAQAVREFGGELWELLAHASVPFQRLAEELAPPRRRDRHPIFQTMFVHQEAAPPPRLGAARLEPLTLDLGESKFDLTLFVNEGAAALEIAVEYRADRFDEVWMEGLLGHYATLLERLPEDLDRTTAEVPMLGDEERAGLRAAASGPALEAGTALLPRQILDRASGSPGSPAVSCGGVRRSYGELAGSAGAIAGALAAAGVRAGDRVGLFVDRSLAMIDAIVGIHWAAAAYVPLDPGYPAERNRLQLEDAYVRAVVTTSALRDRLPAGGWTAIEIDALRGAAARPPATAEVAPDSPAYILYTSGSTGRPKGVVVTHANLRASTAARRQFYGALPERFLLLPSIAFDSSVAGIFSTLAAGGALVVPTDDEARDPRQLARLVASEGVTGLLCVPSLYAGLLAAGGDLLAGLETVIVAGESCPSRLVAEHFGRLPGVRLFNEYGPTEATVWATAHEVGERDAAHPIPIGRPIPGVRVELLDPLGRPVPVGIPGEAWIAGPTVAAGYWRRRDPRFAGEGSARRYRTGDRMAWTADRRLLFLGREDEQIKLRGFRIEPGEVETALSALPGIERAAVVARAADDPAAAVLVAFVRTSAAGAVAGWRRALGERLPEHMIPGRLVELAELPRLPNGKTDRRRLREMALEPEPRVGVAEEAVASTLEQGLVALWEGLLGRTGIGPRDNFFELGGHSLLAFEMTLAIEQDHGVALSAADVFAHPTIGELGRRIVQRGRPQVPPYRHLFALQPGGRKMPFVVAVPHFFSAMLAARFRGERPVYGLRGVSLRPEGNLGRWRTMTELGEELVDEIGRRFPGESCVLAGYSFGASMAMEAARVMEARGMPAHRLYLIAPMPLDLYRLGPLRVQLDGLRQPVEELGLGQALRLWARGNSPLTRRPYRRAWRRLAVEPWRRLLCQVGRLRRLAGLPLTSRILHADVRVDRFRLHARYRPGPVRVPTVIFNPVEPATDAAATWRNCFAGPLTVHPTPDPHDAASVEAARRVILAHLADLGD